MNGDSGPPWAPAGTSPGPPPTSPEPQWAANMLLVIQALQRLHFAFDGKFIHSKSNP